MGPHPWDRAAPPGPYGGPVSAEQLPTQDGPVVLAEDERLLLDLQRRWWEHGETLEAAVRARLGRSLPDYFRDLNRLVDRPEALTHDPQLVRRLRRQRATRSARRRQARSAG